MASQSDASSSPAPKKPKKVSVARARLEHFFDPGTFEEIGAQVAHRSRDFGMERRVMPGDGVVTGLGQVNGRTVFAFAQDRTILGGSLGEAHASKIVKLFDMALRARAPIVAMNDSGGARIQEGVDSLAGYGEIFRRNVMASGIIPQISLIFGPCAGGAVYSPALTDFIGMVEGQSYMFLTGPKVVKSVTFEEVTIEALGGAQVHAQKTGVTHFAFADDQAALQTSRQLLSYLPSSCDHPLPHEPKAQAEISVESMPLQLNKIVPDDPRQAYDVKEVIELVVDQGSFLELHELWAPNLVVGFARLGGYVVGILANQPLALAGVLDVDASRKGARFIRTCNAYRIPVISFVDVPGFLPGTEQEYQGVISHGAKLLYAYCEATVPKLSVILRKAYGGAYIVMSSKHIGGDINLAWPTAEIAVMGAKGAVEILYSRELRQVEQPEERREELEGEYKERFLSPARASARGYVDEVIEPCETRRKLFRFLQAFLDKKQDNLPRYNGNLPT